MGYNSALTEALNELNRKPERPQVVKKKINESKNLKEDTDDSNGPDSKEYAFKCIRKLCDDAALAVTDSDIRNAIDTVSSFGGNFIRTDLICLDGGSTHVDNEQSFALHIPTGNKQLVFLIKDEDNPKISSRYDVRSVGPSDIKYLETTRKNNDQLKFYHHDYPGMPARLSMDKKQEESVNESKELKEDSNYKSEVTESKQLTEEFKPDLWHFVNEVDFKWDWLLDEIEGLLKGEIVRIESTGLYSDDRTIYIRVPESEKPIPVELSCEYSRPLKGKTPILWISIMFDDGRSYHMRSASDTVEDLAKAINDWVDKLVAGKVTIYN